MDCYWHTSITKVYTRLTRDYWLWIISTPSRKSQRVITIIIISRRYCRLPFRRLPLPYCFFLLIYNTYKNFKTIKYMPYICLLRKTKKKKKGFKGHRLDHPGQCLKENNLQIGQILHRHRSSHRDVLFDFNEPF